MIADVGRGVPLLHLYGKAGGRPPLSALLETMLLRLRAAVVDGAAISVPALPRFASPSRAGQLPLGRGGHSADRDYATEQLGHPARELQGPVINFIAFTCRGVYSLN